MKKAELLDYKDKLTTIGELKLIREKFGRLVVTSGSFDLLHPDHLRYIETAKSLGDTLVLSLDSDDYVRSRKTEKRPIISFEARACLLSYFQCVDYVIKSEGDDIATINALQPDVYVQSESTTQESLEAKKPIVNAVEENGGDFYMLPAENKFGLSTSSIVRKVLNNYNAKT